MQKDQHSRMTYQPRNTKMGKGFYRKGQLVQEPFDFSSKNRLTLSDLHAMLQAVIFPQAINAQQRFDLTENDYRFLYRYMSMKPTESDFPAYQKEDAYVKFLLYGGKGMMNEKGIRIFNKPGDAYGFLTDVAYIVDLKNKVEFFLSASIHCNEDGIYNDDHYDYETIGFPFMKNLGRLFYDYERSRKKKYLPDLSAFRINYRN